MKGALHKIMNKNKQEIIFVRHGQTKMNADGDRIRGWIDVPLNEAGKKEARKTGENLKKESFYGILSSDLTRAVETADIISKETGKPILGYSKDLRPWHAGIYAGQESNKVISKLNEYLNHPTEKVPEGESFDTFKKRFLTALLEIKKYFKGKTILIVAHHRNNVCLDAWLAAGEKKDFSIKTSEMEKKGISPSEYKIYYI